MKNRRGDGERRGDAAMEGEAAGRATRCGPEKWKRNCNRARDKGNYQEEALVPNIRSYRELDVYKTAMSAAMEIYEMTKAFPVEEKYSMVDQIRRSSRSVCANLAEAWRRRRYPSHFVSKLTDSDSEADETRVWLEFSLHCRYIGREQFQILDDRYDKILAQLVKMSASPESWTIR